MLNTQKDFGIKRRWDDDVIFKNQARGGDDKNKKKEFVNVSSTALRIKGNTFRLTCYSRRICYGLIFTNASW